MAEILSFTGRLNPEGAVGLIVALAQAFAGGTDLGPRGPQIHALGLSLDSLIGTLRSQLDRLDACLTDDRQRLSDRLEFRTLLATSEHLAQLARAYRAADTPSVDGCQAITSNHI